ncbi:MAG: aminoacyl-histidine dipeptidase [Salinivirgaceae bacterium]|nr:aminoacyl-histidine dipeptidase [Salinivirgaceae bacterium]
MSTLNTLEPKLVWSYFEEICQVPRPSKQEEKIIEYLVEFAKKHNLKHDVDSIGNVLISKPATKGLEHLETVVLQSHMDMVCEANKAKKHDFSKDAIVPVIDGNWVKADGTTLGADDGIGIAAELAILVDESIEHGPVECLFTVDEETGLTGAFALEPDFFKGKYLINLDSEDEGELFIGCAGGIDTLATFAYKEKLPKKDHVTYTINITGLKGGHSGDEIHKGLGNSVKLVGRFLQDATQRFKIRLSHIDGGKVRNAIPREATAVFTVDNKYSSDLENFFQKFEEAAKNELQTTEPGLEITLKQTGEAKKLINKKVQNALLRAIRGVRHGVFEMSRDIPDLVETSTNLASVKMKDKNIIELVTSQRSSVESARNDAKESVASVFRLAGAKVRHSDGYPGWQPNTNSEILNITKTSYEKLFKTEPIVRAIHAGLECGLFLEKYPYLDMISFGPTIRDAHSPDEKIDIETTQKFWDLLLDVLKKIPAKK